MSLHFLFISKDIPGNWFQRLFGPDSLFPNLRDIKDITGMVRWFLFKGPKPTFERWTYWEKFDFLAVFWGMFAIGGSGLMLWFPEFFGNSCRAGCSTWRPSSTPTRPCWPPASSSRSISSTPTDDRRNSPWTSSFSTDRSPSMRFIEERGDQWQRYEEAGITEKFAAKKTSGVIYDFLIKGFGFIALFIGIILLFLMIYAILTGGMG